MIEEYLIGQQIPGIFVPLIPLHYAQMVEQGELMAVGAYDTWEDEAVGVLLFRQQEGWMELVWLNFSENYRESEGALLFERQENDLIFSCAWAAEPKKMMAMLVSALAQAERELPEDTTILIPVLGHRVAELVERLVPTAACRMIDEWSLGFRI